MSQYVRYLKLLNKYTRLYKKKEKTPIGQRTKINEKLRKASKDIDEQKMRMGLT